MPMSELLQFEIEKCQGLRRFPMYFRLKLDISGIKLSKRDWNNFPLSEKQQFCKKLKTMIQACNGELIELSPERGSGEHNYPWTNRTHIPASVEQHLNVLSKDSTHLHAWAALSDLQRFALIKLTQPGHEKEELRIVLEEFSMLPAAATSPRL
jgi:hypothetical protein